MLKTGPPCSRYSRSRGAPEHLEPQLERIALQRVRHLVDETLRGEGRERMQRRAPPAARQAERHVTNSAR